MKPKFLPFLASSLVICTSSHAADVTWVGTTTGNWNTTTNWSSSAAPVAGNAYIVDGSGKTINSTDAASNTFAGDSLTVKNGAILRLFRTNGGGAITSTQTIPNLTVDGATIRFASSAGSLNFKLANQVTFANAVTVETNDTGGFANSLSFDNGFTGSGTLALQRSGTTGSTRTLTIAGTNSTSGYSGNVTASGSGSSDTIDLNINTASGWGTGSLTANAWSRVTLQTSVSSATSALAVNTNAVFSLGTTTFTGASLNQGGGTINMSVGGTTSGLIAVSGNATFTGGSLAVSVLENPVGKTYDLLTYGGSLTGTPSVTGDFGRLTASVNNGSGTNDKVTLGFTGSVGNLTWKGNVDSNWNNNLTANFDNGGSPDVFRSFDNVTFDNTATTFTPTIATSFQAGTVAFNNTTDYTVSGAGGLTGGTSITKTGAGTVTISTPNTYTGNVTITGGTIKAGSATALGAAVVGGGTYISGGGALDINAQNLGGELVTIEGTGVGGNGAIVNSGASQTQALRFVTLSDDASIGGMGRWDIRGNTTATLNLAGHKLTKAGANYIAIVAANVTSGDIDVNEGTLGFSTTTTVNGTGTVKVNSGGNLEIAYGTVAANITRNIVLNGGTLSSVSTASAANSNISLTASSVISSGSLTLNGNVTESGGSYGITINNNSTVNFTGATSFTGGLSVGSTAANATTVTLSSLTTAAGKEIRISNSTASGTANQTLNVNGTVANSGTLSVGRVGVLNVNNGASWTQSGDMSVYGIGGYSGTMNVQAGASFASTGTNPIQLNGAASNSGQARLNISGTGTMTTATGFAQTTTPTTGYGRVTLSGGGTLKLSANVSTLTNQVQFALGTGGGVIDTNGHDATLSGAVTVGSGAALATGISGAGGLTKQGTGTLTLSGTNTYTGATTVSAGTLLVSGALGNTAVTVDSGGTIGGTGSLGGSLAFDGGSFLRIADIADPLAVTGTISFGSGFGIDNLLGLNWDELTLNTPYTLISTTQTFSITNIANFGIANAANVGTGRQAYFEDGSLAVVVIPEPSSVSLVGGLGAMLLLRRRRP